MKSRPSNCSSNPDLNRGSNNKPKQYIQGWTEFYKLKFKVTPDVLIPRPETELLVDEVICFADHPERDFNGEPFGSELRAELLSRTAKRVEGYIVVLDIGTGAGNIAISIAKNAPKAKIIATDISKKALNVAKQNAKSHRVQSQISFIRSNLLQNIQRPLAKLSIPTVITANLPYIPTHRIPFLDPSVKDFEPLVALDGGPDGFDLYRKLFRQICQKYRGVNLSHLRGDIDLALIVCEIDYTHGELAVNEAQKYFPEAQVEVKHDLAKKQRILLIRVSLPR